MRIGMLWFDNSQNPLDEKVQGAVDYYRTKYGRTPTAVFVNPKDGEDGASAAGCRVHTSRSIFRNHLWLGMEEQP